jgi:hypothetical protein
LTTIFHLFSQIFFFCGLLYFSNLNASDSALTVKAHSDTDSIRILHDTIDPDKMINHQAFKLAYFGYQNLKHQLQSDKSHILTIIDYSKPSVEKRLYVVDLDKQRIIHNSLVAHGMNSGANMASKFSNKPGSLQSSLGFYTTGKTYYGKHGYSLKLTGIETGINDNAYDRAIVIHGANYATEKFIKKNGRLGRSWGCPALPPNISRSIIDTIKEGSFLFIYHPDPEYTKKSQLLKNKNL